MKGLPPLSGSAVAFRPLEHDVSGAVPESEGVPRPGWSSPNEDQLTRQALFLSTVFLTVLFSSLAIAGEVGVLADQRESG